MNEVEFKHHLKDLVQGHHHPEEHDWQAGAARAPIRPAVGKPAKAAKATRSKPSNRKKKSQ